MKGICISKSYFSTLRTSKIHWFYTKFFRDTTLYCDQILNQKIKKSNIRHSRLIPFLVSRVSDPFPRICARAHKGCSGGESLAMCGRFERLEIWTPYFPHQKQTCAVS